VVYRAARGAIEDLVGLPGVVGICGEDDVADDGSPFLSGNRVLFRTFSFILLTFIPLSPSFPLIMLTHTFLYTFQFSLMITGKANEKRIH
jgi:hypothetical protein